jgi:hypothetical protein
VRKLAEYGETTTPGALRRHERRALLAERALQSYFFAVVCFVVSGVAIGIDHLAADRLTWLPVAVTLLGMGLIVAGSAAMLAECRLAVAELGAEIKEEFGCGLEDCPCLQDLWRGMRIIASFRGAIITCDTSGWTRTKGASIVGWRLTG